MLTEEDITLLDAFRNLSRNQQIVTLDFLRVTLCTPLTTPDNVYEIQVSAFPKAE